MIPPDGGSSAKFNLLFVTTVSNSNMKEANAHMVHIQSGKLVPTALPAASHDASHIYG